jgi:hypothetical protein
VTRPNTRTQGDNWYKDDFKVLTDRMFSSANGERIEILWNWWETDEYESHSEADLAFCSHLAFYCVDAECDGSVETAGDEDDRYEWILAAVMESERPRQSDKWGRENYQRSTIRKAINSCQNVYTARPKPAVSKPKQAKPRLIGVSLLDWADQNGQETEWFWESTIPLRGLGIIQAAQKLGKSTLVRNLIVACIKGEAFLGRQVKQGKVLYLPYEEDAPAVRDHILQLFGEDKTGIENILIPVLEEKNTFRDETGNEILDVQQSIVQRLQELIKLVETHRPILVVIDTMIPFLKHLTSDLNDYEKTHSAMMQIKNDIALKYNCAIIFLHHEGKQGAERDSLGHRGIGSVAIPAVASATISISKRGEERIIDCEGRETISFGKAILRYDQTTGKVLLDGSYQKAMSKKYESEILAAFEKFDGPTRHENVLELIEGDPVEVKTAFRGMVGKMIFHVSGKGRKNDPKLYWTEDVEVEIEDD